MLDISEIAASAGVAPSTLRYYEKRGLLRADGRRAGRRQYDPSVLTRLAVIEMGRTAGFTLSEIKTIMDSGVDRDVLHRMAHEKLTELDARIAEAQLARRYLEHTIACASPDPLACTTLQQILNNVLPRRT